MHTLVVYQIVYFLRHC